MDLWLVYARLLENVVYWNRFPRLCIGGSIQANIIQAILEHGISSLRLAICYIPSIMIDKKVLYP
jgi:hypothetical protein